MDMGQKVKHLSSICGCRIGGQIEANRLYAPQSAPLPCLTINLITQKASKKPLAQSWIPPLTTLNNPACFVISCPFGAVLENIKATHTVTI